MYYELRDDLPDHDYCDDPLFELFYGKYLNPENYLKNKDNINEVNNAICIVKHYLNDLKDRNLLES